MLNRQKCLLYMIQEARRSVTHLELTKWAFLLAQETASRGGPTFYQFLPYKLGPFSFCLFREIRDLVVNGYLVEEGQRWRVVEDVKSPTSDLSPIVREDATCVVQRFRDRSDRDLTAYVYKRFPWYTVNSSIKKMHPRPEGTAGVFTAGYQGWLVDGFLNMLMLAGIHRVADVRNNPVARRYGFHERTLSRLCGYVQIEYVHLPELGIPSELRQGLEQPKQFEALFDRYEAEVLPREARSVLELAALVKERATVLMCVEADPDACHRTRLADAISRISSLPVQHLRGQHEARF